MATNDKLQLTFMPLPSKTLRQTKLLGTLESSSSPTKSPSPRKSQNLQVDCRTSRSDIESGSDGDLVAHIKLEPQLIAVEDSDRDEDQHVRPRKRLRLSRVDSTEDTQTHISTLPLLATSQSSGAVKSESESDEQRPRRKLIKGKRPSTPEESSTDEIDVDCEKFHTPVALAR